MTGVGENDSSLATQCLALCQSLASQGMAFNFSLSIGSTFSFSLDTRSKEKNSLGTKKKKQSPSTLRRNARRREEFAKKKQASSAEILADDEELVTAPVLKCDQCWSFRKGVKTTHEDEAQDQWSSTPAGGTQRFSKCCETSGSISSEGNPRGAAN